MEDRFLQQLKKGVLELLVLHTICEQETYGYELLTRLKDRSDGLLTLKEGTLYPILYRLEDDGMIVSKWSTGCGKTAPKKMYAATEQGWRSCTERWQLWEVFSRTVSSFQQPEGEQKP